MSNFHQEFLSELKNKIVELEEEPYEILMLSDYASLNIFGVQINSLKKGNKYILPYYIAHTLVSKENAEWTDHRETHSSLLNKLVNLFGIEQRSNAIQKLDAVSIGNLLLILKETVADNGENDLNLKIQHEWRNLINQRIKKILTKYKIDGTKEIKKSLDPLEDKLFNEIHLIIQIYEQFMESIFKTVENTE